MKRKKFYLLITLLITVIIFSTAAICNQCSLISSTTEKVGAESTTTTGTTTAQTISETTATIEATATTTLTEIEYKNTQYGFSFSLPISWEGYYIIISEWEGNTPGQQGDVTVEQGPIISIRHPKWTSANPRQDIPIMVFTIAQWDALQQEKFYIGAGPVGPSELGRNTRYVFALPARYNYSFPIGFEEVEKILESKPFQAF